MKYYVYQATGINGELLYIGKGKGDRYKHCNSGISHCYGLNEYHFKHGRSAINTSILAYFETELEALHYEKECIQKLKPKLNTKETSPYKYTQSLRKVYFDAVDLELYELGLKKYTQRFDITKEKLTFLVNHFGLENLLNGVYLTLKDLKSYNEKDLSLFADLISKKRGSTYLLHFFMVDKIKSGCYNVCLNTEMKHFADYLNNCKK